jgi:hypothetical protein
MAKAKTGTDVALRKSTEIAVDVPDYLKGFTGRTGTETIESADITIPRIKIGQSMSDEVKDGTLKEGSLFLNVTKEVLAEPGKPLIAVPLWRGKEFILWRPRKDNGGGILARARAVPGGPDGVRYKWDKPNTKFEVKVDGKTKAVWETKEFIDQDGLDAWGSEIPGQEDSGIAATAHHNYLVVLPEHGDLIAAFSLSKSQAKKAKDFNALLKLAKGVPMWARAFTVTTVDEQNDQGKFKNVVFANAGYVTQDQYKSYAAIAASYAGKIINVDQSDEDDGEAKDGRL